MGMAKVGRPRIIETPEEFERRALEYFARCDADDEPYTVTGLALALGFSDRQSLNDYQARPEFSAVVKWARLVVESSYEKSLATGRVRPAGPIFVMKNLGWRDKSPEEANEDAETFARKVLEFIALGSSTVRAN